jgi:hypothetical protein
MEGAYEDTLPSLDGMADAYEGASRVGQPTGGSYITWKELK